MRHLRLTHLAPRKNNIDTHSLGCNRIAFQLATEDINFVCNTATPLCVITPMKYHSFDSTNDN